MSNPKEKPFTVFDTKTERGRIALANHDMHPGDLLLAARPYASVIKKEHRTQYCNFCWKKKQADANLLRCSKCKSVYYCSKECQLLDWQLHKYECQRYLSIRPKRPTETTILAFRVLLRERFEKSGELLKEEGNTFENFEILQANRHENESIELSQKYMAMSVMIHDFVGEGYDLHSNTVLDLISKLETNSFVISDGELRPIGIGVYPTAALINHSCAPNCVTVFNGSKVSIRAIRDIAKGEEIAISYIEIAMAAKERRLELWESFHFVCNCERCTESNNESSNDRFLCGLRCPYCEGLVPRWTDCNKHETDIDVEEEKDTDNNTSQLSETNKTVAKTIKNEEESSRNEQDETKTNVQIQQNEDELPKGLEVLPISRKEHKEGVCEKCGKALNKKEVEERYQESRLLLQQADQYAAMKDQVNRQIALSKAVHIQKDLLYRYNTELFDTLDKYLSCCIDSEEWSKANDVSSVVVYVAEVLYPPTWPVLGLQYMIKAKLLWHLGKAHEAQEFIYKAWHVLHITHGEEGELWEQYAALADSIRSGVQHGRTNA